MFEIVHKPLSDIGCVSQTDVGSLQYHTVDSTRMAVGFLQLLVRRSGTHCQMKSNQISPAC